MAYLQTSTWYNIPFVVGHHIAATNDIIIQDGFLSSIQLFLVVIALGSALIFAAWITEVNHNGNGSNTQTNKVTATHLDIFLIIIMLVSCILILILCKYFRGHFRQIHSHNDCSAVNQPLSLKIRSVLKKKLPLIGIVLFFIPSIFLDFFTLAAEVQCLCAIPADHIFDYVTKIVFDLSRATFLSVLVGFALLFHHKRSTRHMVLIRYILMWILAATLLLWLDIFVHELIHHGKEAELHEYFLKMMEEYYSSSSIGESSDLLIHCLHQNTSLFDFKEVLSSYLYPLNIEFALLVTEIVAHIYIAMNYAAKKWKKLVGQRSVQLQCVLGMSASVRDTRCIVMNESHGQPGSGSVGIPRESFPGLDSRHHHSHSRTSGTEDFNAGEHTPLLSQDNHPDQTTANICDAASTTSSVRDTGSCVLFVHRQYTDISQSSSQSLRGPYRSLHGSGILGDIINLALITMAVLKYNGLGTDSPSFTAIYTCARVAYFLTMIMCTYTALYNCKGFNSRFQSYNGLEMIVILSQAVIFVQDFMYVIAYVGSVISHDGHLSHLEGYVIPCLQIANNITNTVSMLLQTAVMFHTTRVSAPERADRQCNNLKQCLLFLAISNISMWTIDSFFEISRLKKVDPIQMEYYGGNTWYMISYITVPFAIFYRFNAFFILLGGYLSH